MIVGFIFFSVVISSAVDFLLFFSFEEYYILGKKCSRENFNSTNIRNYVKIRPDFNTIWKAYRNADRQNKALMRLVLFLRLMFLVPMISALIGGLIILSIFFVTLLFP